MDRPTIIALAESFMQRFAGLDSVYGTYDLSKTTIREDGKRSGEKAGITKRAPVTVELWEKHLEGKGVGLGIVPIRSDNTAVFGAIDVDIYPVTHQSIVAKLKRSNLPFVVCRTKSAGAHLYLFSKSPVPAASLVKKLNEVASFLGYGDCEKFPKQTQILVEQGDCGQWINMPYFGGIRGMRYAVDIDGNGLTPEQFLEYAEEMSVDPEWFDSPLVVSTEFNDGPPCLQALSQIGYPTGTRNDGLYNIGVYLKRSRPDDWENQLDDMNHKYMEPPLTMPEVQGTIKSLRKKDYTYGCTKQPICNHCNAALCRTRKFGVGSGTSGRFPMLGGLTKLNTKPPIWFWTVDGVRMELSTSDLQDPRCFQRRCMDYLNVMPQIPSRPVWEAAVQHAMDTTTIIEAPADASPEGQFWEMVEKFCTGRAQALTIEEIVLSKPFSDKGRTYFKIEALISFLTMHKFFEFKSVKIASMLKDAGADHHFKIMKGRGVNFWSIPEFARQSEGFDVPQGATQEDEPF